MHRISALVRPAAFAAAACLIGACGGGTGDASQDANASAPQQDPTEDSPAGIDTSQDAPTAVLPPVFSLTGPIDQPDGTILDPASCVDEEESGPPYFDHYVPTEWTRRGAGSSGSGGISTSGDHSYEMPDGSLVHLEVVTDTYVGTEPTGSDGQPWRTWDYEITTYDDSGESTVDVVYEPVDRVTIDGETFDLYHLDQSQADAVSRSEYRLRITFADVPTGGVDGRDRRPESATVILSWNAEDGEVSEQVARDVFATFRLAPCAQDGLTELYERMTGTDFSN